jgi:hypothetical protein
VTETLGLEILTTYSCRNGISHVGSITTGIETEIKPLVFAFCCA